MKRLLLLCSLFILACSSDDNVAISDNTVVLDVDGNSYALLLIADEIWSTQNLRTKTYRDGTLIPYVEDPIEWENLTTGAWRYVNNDPATEEKYGLLYNFYAVNNPKGLSPEGTRIPSYNDFLHLTSYFGASLNGDVAEEIFSGFLTDDSEHPWVNLSGITLVGTNVTGLNLYPAGIQTTSFSSNPNLGFGWWTNLWSSDSATQTPQNKSISARWALTSPFSVSRWETLNYYGCSVRFVKN